MEFRDLATEILDLVHSKKPFTDVHMTADQPMMIKTPAGWTVVGDGEILPDDMGKFLNTLDKNWKEKVKLHAIDKPISLGEVRLRCNIFRTDGSTKTAVSIRVLPKNPPDLGKLGLPPYMGQIISKNKGLVIITGPTGSGKTTTVASFINHLNRTRQAHIVTIEEPIEYQFERNKSIFSQKEVPTDTESFASGLREAVRQKPDIIMIGEVRDRETAETMLQAAESGHLVFATLHTNTADGAISKILSWFEGETEEKRQMLAQSLIAVVCQNLLPTRDGDSFILGYELLVNNPQVSKAISEPGRLGTLRELMKQHNEENRMSRAMNDVLLELLKADKIRVADAQRASNSSIELMEVVRKENIKA
ncbi:MAG: twitching motility protein [Chloroflexota bacterium]|jgi:twitching motility protein PilT|nr:MAG: twitching motility protein [Chloroflexota bacterium]